MKASDFFHGHVHTDASPDGLGNVSSLVKAAKEIGFTHLAMTDHGTLANAVTFWKTCVDTGITPVLGYEGYLAYNGNRHHITLNAISRDGFDNLIRLNNHAHKDGYAKGYPVFTMDDLNYYNDGIAAFTGCPASPLHEGTLSDGMEWAGKMTDIFGTERLFAEIMYVLDEDKVSRPEVAAKKFGLTPIITNDVHFVRREHVQCHKNMCTARKGFNYKSDQLWLKTPEEVIAGGAGWSTAANIEQWARNTMRVIDLLDPYTLEAAPTLPTEPGSNEKLKKKIYEKLAAYNAENPSNAAAATVRVDREWSVLDSKGFVDYLFILDDIITEAHKRGIMIGCGRGSAAGSMIVYLLNITTVDPLKYNLMFERFLNPARDEFPDVDVDIDSDRRHELLEYANKKWGAVPIATYSTYSHSSLVRDIGRVLSIDRKLTAEASEGGNEGSKFREFIGTSTQASDMYEVMLGQIRHRGKHPGGVVITDQPVPIERSGDVLTVSWTEGWNKELTIAGITKYDLLGLISLSMIQRMRDVSGKTFPGNYDNPEVFKVFQRGDTAGIFQWTGGDGIRELTMNVQPESINDLIAINALYRPGPIDSGMADKYPEYKKKPRLLHPDVDAILAETYGIIVFQEQFMELMALFMGGGLPEADLARRVIVKPRPEDPSWIKKADKLRRDFFEGGEKRYGRELTAQLYEEIHNFARYGFNKAHATCYSMIAYEMAWHKVYTNEAYYVALLDKAPDLTQAWLYEAVKGGAEVVVPHVNTSGNDYSLKDGKLYLPLSSIKFFSDKSVLRYMEEREENGPYTSYEEFDERVERRACNNRVRKLLSMLGCFEGLTGAPSSAINDYEDMPVVTREEAQIEALGFVLPTPKSVKWIDDMSKQEDVVAGFVKEIDKRKSKRGPYNVYRLAPSGSFWARKEKYRSGINVGDLVAVKKSSYGSPINAWRFKDV